MNWAMIHYNRITGLESWAQTLLDITQKCWPVHRTLNYHWRRHLIMAQPSDKGDGFPFSLRNMTDQPLATRAAAPDTDHIRGDRRLVDKDQPRRIKEPLLLNPTSARSRYVFSMSLGCTKAFFYRSDHDARETATARSGCPESVACASPRVSHSGSNPGARQPEQGCAPRSPPGQSGCPRAVSVHLSPPRASVVPT